MNLNEYYNYLHERGLTPPQMSKWTMYQKYGVVALLSISASGVYNTLFRMESSQCVRGCGKPQSDRRCYNMCYLRATNKVLAQIRADGGTLNKIDPPKKRLMVKERLQKQFEKWEKRQEKYEKLLTI